MSDDKKLEQKYEMYQDSCIGRSFLDEIQVQVDNLQMDNDTAAKATNIFSEVMSKHMDLFSKQSNKIELNINGKLNTYRYCENSWELECVHAEVKYVKPVACSSEKKEAERLYIKAIDGSDGKRRR